MKVHLMEQQKKYGLESFVVLVVFYISWIGFGQYMLAQSQLPEGG